MDDQLERIEWLRGQIAVIDSGVCPDCSTPLVDAYCSSCHGVWSVDAGRVGYKLTYRTPSLRLLSDGTMSR